MNKKAIILGASSGIGKELAKVLANNGYKVGITGRRAELLEEMKSEKSESFVTKIFDIGQTDIVAEKLEKLTAELGGLDLLIISSGIGDINENLDFAIEQRIIKTNVEGFTCTCDWGFRYFENQQYGHLVGITSIAGVRGSRHSPAYNATKAYQTNYLEGLRQKAVSLKKPIHVTEIRPGLVNTAMAKGNGLFWVMPIDKVAKQIYKAIHSKRKIACVTKRWRIINFILKQIPNTIYTKM
jgi:short-subunit dehydrogenase